MIPNNSKRENKKRFLVSDGSLAESFRYAQHPELRCYAALLVIAAGACAFRLGLALSSILHFTYHDSHGIVGWIHLQQYPKQQEFFFFLGSLLGLPAIIFIFWACWISSSALIARLQSDSEKRVLKHQAIAFTPFLLFWYNFLQNTAGLRSLLALVIVLSTLLSVSLAFFRYLRPIGNQRTCFSFQSKSEHPKASPAKKASAYLWCIALGKYLLIPLAIYAYSYQANISGMVDFFHEGERLAPLNEILRGKLPYRDIYIQHGLFKNYFHPLLAAQLFEPTLAAIRSSSRMLEPLAYVIVYLLGTQIFRFTVLSSLLLVLLSSAEGFWVAPRQGIALLSTALLANYVSRTFADYEQQHTSAKPWTLFGAGIVSGLSFWYSVEMGLYSIAANSVFLILLVLLDKPSPHTRRMVSLVGYLCAVLLGLSSIALALIYQGVLTDAIYNTYYQCAYQLSIWGQAFPSLFVILQKLAVSPFSNWFEILSSPEFRMYLTPLAMLLTGGYLSYRYLAGTFWSSSSCSLLLLLLISSAAFFRTALGRSDYGHWIDASSFLWVLFLFPLDRLLAGIWDSLFTQGLQVLDRAVIILTRLAFSLPLLLLFYYIEQVHKPIEVFWKKASTISQRLGKTPCPPELVPRAGSLRIPQAQADQINLVVSFIQEHTSPDDTIFDFSSNGAYYFFANRPAACRYHQVVYASTAALQEEIIDALDHKQTPLVIYKTGSVYDAIDGVSHEKRHPLIADYLRKNYQEATDINGTVLLLRK